MSEDTTKEVGIITIEERAVLINKELEKAGVASWGRASKVSKDIEVSPATAAGWLSGSLPRDCVALLRFCNFYGIDANYWVTGEPSADSQSADSPSFERMKRVVTIVRQFEVETGVVLSPDEFSEHIIKVFENEENHTYLLQNWKMMLIDNKD